MKLRIFPFDNEIIFTDDFIPVVEIEDKKLFARICQSINQMIDGQEALEKLFLLEDQKELSFAKHVFYVGDIFNIEVSERSIERLLYQAIEDEFILDYEDREKLLNQLNQVAMMIRPLLDEFDFELSYLMDVPLVNFLKAMDVEIVFDMHLSAFERVQQLIDLYARFKLKKLIIFVNLKSMLTTEEIEQVYQYAFYKKMRILLLESVIADKCFEKEEKLRIDMEFDEEKISL